MLCIWTVVFESRGGDHSGDESIGIMTNVPAWVCGETVKLRQAPHKTISWKGDE